MHLSIIHQSQYYTCILAYLCIPILYMHLSILVIIICTHALTILVGNDVIYYGLMYVDYDA